MADWIGSPNYTQGRQGSGIDHIVIHWMVGTLASTDAVFQDTNRGTSAHYGVQDNTVHQYVRDTDTAYHAGTWPMNIRSIGIEHSAAPGRDASPQTIETSAQLIAAKCSEFGIPCDRGHIIKHSEVIATACPGTIPIDALVARAAQILNGGSVVASQDTADRTTIELEYNNGLFRNASEQEIADMLNAKLTVEQVQRTIQESAEHAKLVAIVKGAKGTVLKPGTYTVN